LRNRFKYLSGLLLVLFALSACEKVIDFDLSGSREAIVIEATITNSKLPFTVLVSKTSPYFGTKTKNPVSGAKVSVRAEKGKTKYFVEIAPGLYQLEKTPALPGYWYVVDVEYDGITYSARSFMNEAVPIADLSFSYFDGFGFFDSGYKVNTYVRDPVNKENYYRLKYYVNGQTTDDQGEITLYSDQLFDGKDIGLGQRTIVFKETDTLTIELQSIDKAAYNYFSTLESISGNEMQQTASPSNPISNFSNGALGYFSAYTFDRKTAIIKDYIRK
jgi:hypothetical protein